MKTIRKQCHDFCEIKLFFIEIVIKLLIFLLAIYKLLIPIFDRLISITEN